MGQLTQRPCLGVTRRNAAAAALLLPLCGALLLTARPALGQEQMLPKADKILDQYVEATGGKAAYKKVKNRVLMGTLHLTSQGLTGTLAIYQARPNLMYTVAEIPAMAKEEAGTDGKVAWQRDMMQGVRLLEGDERKEAIRQAFFDNDIEWRRIYKEAKTVGVEDVKGSPAYKIELTIDKEDKEVRYYDKESHLLVKVIAMQQAPPMGKIPVESFPSDYKEVDGILMPHKITGSIMMQERVITFESIKHNVELEKDRFELPDDVKALLKQQAEKQGP
jgi:hypothetical protein